MTNAGSERTVPRGILDEGIYRAVRRLRVLQGLLVLALCVLVLMGIVGVFIGLGRSAGGGLVAVLPAGIIAVVALVAGLVKIGSSEERAKKTEGFEAASGVYEIGCWIGGGMNFVAGCIMAGVVFVNGTGKGLWVPSVLALAISAVGMILAMPRIRRLRRLFYSPTLPVARV